MLGISIGKHTIPDKVFDLSTMGNNYYFKSGKDVFKITHINIVNDENNFLSYSVTSTNGNAMITSEFKPLDTLYSL